MPKKIPDRRQSGRDILNVLAQIELGVLAALLLIVGGMWGFVEISDEVLEGETRTLDKKILLFLRSADDLTDPIGPECFHYLGGSYHAIRALHSGCHNPKKQKNFVARP